MDLPVDVTDRVCHLECVKGGNVHEFVGPVRLLLVDPPPNEYCRKQWGAAFIQLANMMIGATFLVIFLFTLSFKLNLYNNLHVLLCSVGLQLCFPSGVLMCNELNGASVPLKVKDRVFHHFLLMFFGLACAFAGGVLVYLFGKTSEKKISLHCFVGVGAIVLGLINVIIGPWFYWIKKANPGGCCSRFCAKLHLMFGIPCLIASAGCFILGVLKPVFAKWIPIQDLSNVLIVCCVFYTLVILYVPLRKFCTKTRCRIMIK